MTHQIDTIVALSTPPGRAGIGVIRLSGPASLLILRRLLRDDGFAPEPNLLTLRLLVDPTDGGHLDRALVCYFKSPHSFTGEDVVELHCHGSPLVLRAIIDAAIGVGARMADAGEFSLRAVMNGRMNLSEAEAIRDLIEAQTDAAVRQATRQMKGEISNRLQPAKHELIRIIVRLESSLEFVEDDLPAIEHAEILAALRSLKSDLVQLASTFARGKLIRDGIRVALVGRPNTGKSSLFNRLLGHGRAIVTDLPGTTRDTITEPIGLDGVPILLTDTAGLRSSSDPIESMGVDRTKREAADSDLLIIVIDGSEPLSHEDHDVLSETRSTRQVIALNKSDLPTFSVSRLEGESSGTATPVPIIAVSAKTELGLERLRTAILEPFTNGNCKGEGVLITNARHHDLLERATRSIASSENLLAQGASEEFVVVGLHDALKFIGEITGETTSDEILGQIFSTFCIGK